jgi:hypothetical protein
VLTVMFVGMGAAMLLGIWGDIRRSSKRLLRAALVASCVAAPVVIAWAATMVRLEQVCAIGTAPRTRLCRLS